MNAPSPISSAVKTFRQYMDQADAKDVVTADPKVRAEAKKGIESSLVGAMDASGMDDIAGEREMVAARALSQMAPDSSGPWLTGIADVLNITTADLKIHIGKALDSIGEQPPMERSAFLAAMQPASVEVFKPHASGVEKPSATAVFAIVSNTGKHATPIISRGATLSFEAPVGASYEVVNLNHRDTDGNPTVVAQGEIETKETTVFGAGPSLAPVHVNFGSKADMFPGDALAIQLTVDGKPAASDRIVELPTAKVKLHDGFPASSNRTRSRTVNAKQVSFTKNTIKGKALAVDPFSTVVVTRNGHRTSLEATADRDGKFSVKIPPAWNNDALAIVADDAFAPSRVSLTSSKVGQPANERNADAIFKAVLNGRDGVDVTLNQMAPGTELSIETAAGRDTFIADDNGTMKINCGPLPEGATVTVSTIPTKQWIPGTLSENNDAERMHPRFNPDPNQESSGRFHNVGLKFSLVVPNEAEAQRREMIADSIHTTTPENLAFALDIFGPKSDFPQLAAITDPNRIRTIFLGAQLGMIDLGSWRSKIKPFVERLATAKDLSAELKKDLVDGLEVASGYTGKQKATPDASVQLAQTARGQSRTVAVGGYSPISGSHGRLRPETVRTPDVFQLTLQDLDWLLTDGGNHHLRLEHGAQAAQGWVNPAAIVMTMGIATG